MKHILNIFAGLVLVTLLTACSVSVPKDAIPNNKKVSIFPDYTYVTIPFNIAPCNFHINDDGADEYVTSVEDASGNQLVAGGQDVEFDEEEWHQMLEQNKGNELTCVVYIKHGNSWEHYHPFMINIAPDAIDEYISYRLIPPSYVNYNELSICQRNLTNYDESVIFSNKMLSGKNDNNEYQCINCHSYQNYHTKNFQFHVRQFDGGTMIIQDGKAEKINLKTDSTIGAGVYPSWHPTEPIVAYSLNHTVQTFTLDDADHKIEVFDTLSDMAIYHVDTHEVQIVQTSIDSYETTPGWAPTGDALYYCSAYFPIEGTAHHYAIGARYDQMFYDIIRQSYDVKTRKFGEPDTVFKASAIKKSASFPRISPDGRYLLFGLADYGYFHIWHKSSDLYVKDLKTGNVHPLSKANSKNVDAYHAWSSNGRWIIFSTRREDGNYTRAYIAYFDKNGKDYKAFPVPQKDPLYNKKLLKSYNVTEFMVEPVKISARDLADAVSKDATPAKLMK